MTVQQLMLQKSLVSRSLLVTILHACFMLTNRIFVLFLSYYYFHFVESSSLFHFFNKYFILALTFLDMERNPFVSTHI